MSAEFTTPPPGTPPPGSAEAIERGCMCPEHGNHQGKGQRGNGKRYGWHVSEYCHLHRDWRDESEVVRG